MSTEIKPEAIRDQDEAISLSYWLAEQMGEHVDDQGDETLTETVQRYVRREWMPKTGANSTPAPLDPSKVKAGDTVTVSVTDYELGTYEVKGPVTGHLGGILQVGSTVIAANGKWRDIVTLTDHQPAPEPEPEYRPYALYLAKVHNIPDQRVMWTSDRHHPWMSLSPVASERWHAVDFVTDARPLVVIDPAAVDVVAIAKAMHQVDYPGLDFALNLDQSAYVAKARAALAHLGIEATS